MFYTSCSWCNVFVRTTDLCFISFLQCTHSLFKYANIANVPVVGLTKDYLILPYLILRYANDIKTDFIKPFEEIKMIHMQKAQLCDPQFPDTTSKFPGGTQSMNRGVSVYLNL